MKSASQGVFYILSGGGDASDNSYGGVYDKSTIHKTARVAVQLFTTLNKVFNQI